MIQSVPDILKRPIAYLLLVILAALAASMKYSLPVQDTVLFIIMVGMVFYIPGSLIIDYCLTRRTSSLGILPQIAIPLGTGLCVATVYMHAHYELNLPSWLGLSLILICLGVRTALHLRAFKAPQELPHTKFFPDNSELLASFLLIASLILMLSMSHYQDVTIQTDSYRYLQNSFNETIFHEGLINALDAGYPPRPLYMSGGIDFSYYHLGLHLQVNLIEKLSGLDSTKLIYFYFSSLYFFLIGTLGFSIARMLGANNVIALVTGLLLFGSDFSFVSGLASINKVASYPWLTLYVPVVYSLFTYNGILPGLIAFLCFVVFLIDMFRFPKYRTLIILLFITYCAYLTKSSMGYQIAGVSVLICCLASFKLERKFWITAATGFLLILGWMFYRQGLAEHNMGGAQLSFQPFNMFLSTLNNYDLADLARLLMIPAFLFYVILALGLRYLGYHVVTNLKRSDFDPAASGYGWIVVFFAVFAVSGFFLSEMIVIGYPDQIDNSIWFAVQSLLAAWFLVCMFLVRMQNRASSSPVLASILILIIAYPSTIQFLMLRSDTSKETSFYELGAAEREMISAMKLFAKDAVVLHPINSDKASLPANFAGKDTVLSAYSSFIILTDEVNQRISDIEYYFSTMANIDSMRKIAKNYKVTHVLCQIGECGRTAEDPALYVLLENDKYKLLGARGDDHNTSDESATF